MGDERFHYDADTAPAVDDDGDAGDGVDGQQAPVRDDVPWEDGLAAPASFDDMSTPTRGVAVDKRKGSAASLTEDDISSPLPSIASFSSPRPDNDNDRIDERDANTNTGNVNGNGADTDDEHDSDRVRTSTSPQLNFATFDDTPNGHTITDVVSSSSGVDSTDA